MTYALRPEAVQTPVPRLARWGLWALGAGIVLAVAVVAGIAIGETRIPASTVLQVLANRIFGAGFAVDPIDEGIIWAYRLTRALVAAGCGAGLAISGVILQSLLRNPLADPYLLGISAGASTGAVLVTVAGFGAGVVSMSLGAFGGAVAAFAMVAALARAAGGFGAGGAGARGTGLIILSGIAGSQLFNALTSYLIARAANAEQARGIMFWLMGNLSGVRWDDVWLALPAGALVLALGLWHARALDAFAFGAEAAASMGVPVRRVQGVLILGTALATAALVSIVGSIGFVGLVVPHAARMVVGHRHGALMPAAALGGAVFLILADVISRILVPGQVVPIGVVTALVGAPVFALILIRGRAR